jgi:hypothetical protein
MVLKARKERREEAQARRLKSVAGDITKYFEGTEDEKKLSKPDESNGGDGPSNNIEVVDDTNNGNVGDSIGAHGDVTTEWAECQHEHFDNSVEEVKKKGKEAIEKAHDKVRKAHSNGEFIRCREKKKRAVKLVYKIINKHTGRVGGNGSGGPIYGELIEGHMQKIVNFLIVNCDLTDLSRFIDIGNGRGKPSMHVAQDPGVQFSFGIEIEKLRANLGLYSLYHLLNAAMKDDTVGFKCLFQHGNISEAKSLNPFTHVYLYDVG